MISGTLLLTCALVALASIVWIQGKEINSLRKDLVEKFANQYLPLPTQEELVENDKRYRRQALDDRLYGLSAAILGKAVRATGNLPVDEDVRSVVRVVRVMLDEIDNPTESPKEPERLDDSGG